MSAFSHLTLVSALMGATLLATPLIGARAANSDAAASQSSEAPAGAARSRAETVDQRIAALHRSLKITPDEEADWKDVAGAMRDSAATLEKLAADKAAEPRQDRTAVDDLKTYEQFAHAHVDGLANLTSAFETLYASMPDAQKKIADQVFGKFGHKNATARG
jgi:hypothetical protein